MHQKRWCETHNDSVEVDDTLAYFNAFVLHFATVILLVAWQNDKVGKVKVAAVR